MVLSNHLGWIGVDIGTHTIKLAQAERTATGYALRHAAVIQRTDSWSESELVLAEPQSSGVEIRAALECSSFRGRDAACLLPMNVCEWRGLKVPQGEPRERRAMIENELADDWSERPVPMEFDYWEIAAGGEADHVDGFNVNVIAVTRPWIARLADDCQQARLDCWAVDGGPLAIARAVGLVTSTRNDRRVLAIDWGFSNVTLCIVGNGLPLYARRLHECSFRRCLDAIQSELGVSLDYAQHLADAHGVSPESGHDRDSDEIQTAVTDAVAETLTHLIEQVQRTLKFVETQRRHLRPMAIWLLGGGASMKNIAAYFSHALELPVHVWNVPRSSEMEPDLEDRRAAMFGSAFALSAMAWSAS